MIKSKKFWGIITSFLFLYIALKNVDFKNVSSILKSINAVYMAPMLLFCLCEQLSRAIRWQMILPKKGFYFKTAFFGMVLCYFFNNILPARAGEFFRAWYLKKKGVASASEAFGSVVLERFLDGVVIITFILLSLRQFKGNEIIEKASACTIAFYALLLIFILTAQFKRNFFIRLTDNLLFKLPQAWGQKLRGSRDSFIDGLNLVSKPKAFIKTLFMSFIAWSISLLTYWACLKMFSVSLGPEQICVLVAVLAIGSMIPTTPGMIGVFQYCCVLTLHGIFKVNQDKAAAFGIVCHLICYLTITLLGFFIMTYEGIRLKDAEGQGLTTQKARA